MEYSKTQLKIEVKIIVTRKKDDYHVDTISEHASTANKEFGDLKKAKCKIEELITDANDAVMCDMSALIKREKPKADDDE